jgi:hypothetical protein
MVVSFRLLRFRDQVAGWQRWFNGNNPRAARCRVCDASTSSNRSWSAHLPIAIIDDGPNHTSPPRPGLYHLLTMNRSDLLAIEIIIGVILAFSPAIAAAQCRGYSGPGGPCSGGGRYSGPGGGLYSGPGGGLYAGPGGGMYPGPRGGLYTGPGAACTQGPAGESMPDRLIPMTSGRTGDPGAPALQGSMGESGAGKTALSNAPLAHVTSTGFAFLTAKRFA